jgi:hypothetical protein
LGRARRVGEVFRREVAVPLALDAHFGVPVEDLARVADVELSAPTWPTEVSGQAGSVRWRSLNRPPGALDVAVLNGQPWRTCEFPATGLHATAASIAQFYGSPVDPAGPVASLLGSELYSTFCSPVVVAHDRLLEREVAWTPGLQADEYGLGMAGVGGCDAYADTRYGFGYAYLTRRLGDHSRSERIIAAIESVLDG